MFETQTAELGAKMCRLVIQIVTLSWYHTKKYIVLQDSQPLWYKTITLWLYIADNVMSVEAD